MSYLEKAMKRAEEIAAEKAEGEKAFSMLYSIRDAKDKLAPTPTLKQLRDFLTAVAEVLKALKEAAK